MSCWGENWDGQLGNGQSGDDAISSVPVQVTGITDATAIAAGGAHSCALRRGGTVSCWGSNALGQLGDGNSGWDDEYQTVPVFSSVPVRVVGITDATAITAAEFYSCALHQDGTISCWGGNRYGQLGNGQSGNDVDSSIPLQVTGITDATAITASSTHSCALRRGGTISCWGINWSGKLGNGQIEYNSDSSIPVQVTGITDASAINTGSHYSCALHRNGTISCWGGNSHGHLGNGRIGDDADSSIPVQVTGINDATAISASSRQACALHQDGSVSCWGDDWSWFLGYETGSGSLVPVRVVGIGDATAITTHSRRSCALHRNGTISCWDDDNLAPFKLPGFGG